MSDTNPAMTVEQKLAVRTKQVSLLSALVSVQNLNAELKEANQKYAAAQAEFQSTIRDIVAAAGVNTEEFGLNLDTLEFQKKEQAK